jgi:hypothetical protein
MNASSSDCSSMPSCRPSTSFAYSSCSLEASVFLILKIVSADRGEHSICHLLVDPFAQLVHAP